MVSFENFVKSMPPSLLELKVTPSFCFAFKIPDDPTATNKYRKKRPYPYMVIFNIRMIVDSSFIEKGSYPFHKRLRINW